MSNLSAFTAPIAALVADLRRPKLLIRAARFGMAEYDRNRDLRRLLKRIDAPSPERAVTILMAEEEKLEETRRAGEAAYSIARHIELLIALMAEARLAARSALQG